MVEDEEHRHIQARQACTATAASLRIAPSIYHNPVHMPHRITLQAQTLISHA